MSEEKKKSRGGCTHAAGFRANDGARFRAFIIHDAIIVAPNARPVKGLGVRNE